MTKRKMGVAAGCLAAGLILAGCGGSIDVQPEQAIEITAEPAPTAAQPEPAEPTLDQIEACLVAWTAEKKAFDTGILDDATLRATAFDCPDYETWERMRSEVGYGNPSPNLLRALCAFEATSPVCESLNR